mmetsp:Transcript_5931/g.10266  ORF Transcript_5931/g.10266 Transcript_5931/m.10266 type:complete len:207 (-) Transcript_5931:67-687(-)
MLLMSTIWPAPLERNRGSTALVRAMGACVLRLKRASSTTDAVSSTRPRWLLPAMCTRTSTPWSPKAASAWITAAEISSAPAVRSKGNTFTLEGSPSVFATRCNWSSRRADRISKAPLANMDRAKSSPRPCEAPVIHTTRPSNALPGTLFKESVLRSASPNTKVTSLYTAKAPIPTPSPHCTAPIKVHSAIIAFDFDQLFNNTLKTD